VKAPRNPGEIPGRLRRFRLRWARRWQRSDTRAAWIQRRLRLDGISTGARILIAGCVAAATASTVVLVVESTGRLQIPPISSPASLLRADVPGAVVGCLLLGFAVATATVAAAALELPRPYRAAALSAVALSQTVLISEALRLPHQLIVVAHLTGSTRTALGQLLLLEVVGIVALLAGLVIALVSPMAARWVWGCAPLAFAAPYLLLGIGWWLMARSPAATGVPAPLPDPLPPDWIIDVTVQQQALTLGGLGFAMTLWAAVAAAQAAASLSGTTPLIVSRLSRATARRRGRSWTLWAVVLTLLAVKLVWLGAGVLGYLPRLMGGNASQWVGVRSDGWLSWTIAVAFAILVAGWIARGCPAPSDPRGLAWVGAALVAALAAPEFLFQSLSQLHSAVPSNLIFTAAREVEAVQPWAPVIVAVGALTTAVVLARRRRSPAAVLALAAFGIWAGLRVPLIVADLLGFPWYPWVLGMPSEENGQRPGWVDPATLDLALTLALLVVGALAARRGLQRTLAPVLVIAVAATVLAHPQVLLPGLLTSQTGSYLAFAFPVAYQFLFGAQGLNAPGPRRQRRVLLVAGYATAALAVGVLRGARGAPAAGEDRAMASALLLVPTAVAAVVLVVSRLGRRSAQGSGAASINREAPRAPLPP